MVSLPRLFRLVRERDVTGVSGIGVVAHGVLWPDGTVALRWATRWASTGVYDSMEQVVEIHGHDGATVVEWLAPHATPDGSPEPEEVLGHAV